MKTARTESAVSTAIRIMLATYLAAAIYSLLAGLGVLGCAPPPGGGWRIEWHGHAPIPSADRAVDVILDAAPCAPRGGWYGGQIDFYDDPFQCGPLLVHGCMPDGYMLPTFAVGYRAPLSSSALADEIGHYVFASCGLGLGEDGAGVYEPRFIAWLDDVRTAMRAEGL